MSEATKQYGTMTTQQIADEALRLIGQIREIIKTYYPECKEENDDDDK